MGKACSVAASNHALLGDTLEQARALAVGSRLAVKHGRRLEAVMALDVLAGVVADLLGAVLGGAVIVVKHAAVLAAADAEPCRWAHQIGEACAVAADHIALRGRGRCCAGAHRGQSQKNEKPLHHPNWSVESDRKCEMRDQDVTILVLF